MQRTISTSGILLSALVFLTSCGMTRPDLPEAGYLNVATRYVLPAMCAQYGGVSSADADYLRKSAQQNLSHYNFDKQQIERVTEDVTKSAKSLMGGPNKDERLMALCRGMPKEVAERRSQELHDAQMMAYAAQVNAANAQATAAYSSQIQIPIPTFAPPATNYIAPQVVPITPPGGNQVRCINVGILTNCRY